MTMSDAHSQGDVNPDEIPTLLQSAGVAGAGGAGFPSYAKWDRHEEVDYLLINHQESEPNYYTDKWLGVDASERISDCLTGLLDSMFEAVVVGTKAAYRGIWTDELEAQTDATVYEQDELPFSIDDESGVVFAYTPSVYTYSEESVLLMVTTGTQLDGELPTDRGWIVHNTESLYNISRALEGTPVTRKYVHVDGETPRHRCLEVPIGTPASELLKAAGNGDGTVDDGHVLADGGPGWCYRVDLPPEEFGVRKRTNGVLVLERSVTEANTQSDGEINVLNMYDWNDQRHETQPTTLTPDTVRIPLITNATYEGIVKPSVPVVESGDEVVEGDVIAEPAPQGISNTQHASIDGTVVDVTDTHVVIDR